MVLFKHEQEVSLGVKLELAGCVPCADNFLGELLSELLDRENSEGVVSDGDNAFGTSLGAERARMSQRVVAQRGDAVLSHVFVAEPGSVGKGNDRILALLPHFAKLNCPSSEELLSTVR